jgi:glyoxylase-like metal-dependent hydrolase (beta-lactamase superfamily II)
MIKKDPPVELTDSLVMLGTNEYPLYLVKGGDQGAIFEGGVGSMGPLLQQQLAKLAVPPDFVRQVVVTHAHPDHVMAVPAMQRMFPGVTVCASQLAARTMRAEKAVSFFAQVDDVITESLLKAGSIGAEHKPDPLEEMQISVDCFHAEGDVLVVGDVEFNVLFTPGHSDCSLSFHDPVRGVLIISDATGYYMPPNFWWPNYFSHYGEYLDSIKRLATFEADVLCLSHNAAVLGEEDVKAYFQGAIAATEAYHQRIIDEIQAGKSVREIAGRLGEEVYAKTQLMPVEFFQKNCSLLVKKSMEYEEIEPQEQS